MMKKLVVWMFVVLMMVSVVSSNIDSKDKIIEAIKAASSTEELKRLLDNPEFDRVLFDDTTNELERINILNLIEKRESEIKKREISRRVREPRARPASIQDLYWAASAGKYFADKSKSIEAFEWSEKFFESNFGKFITGEPSFGICESNIAQSGNPNGIVMDMDGVSPVLIAHIEGERTEVISPGEEITTEYFYRFTMQVKPVKNNNNDKPKITYNIDLYNGETKVKSVFEETQNAEGSASLLGTNALVKYSTEYYDKICLVSNVAQTCNRIVDTSNLAGVIGTVQPSGNDGGLASSGTDDDGDSNMQTDW